MALRAPGTTGQGPSSGTVFWRYVIFWVLFLGLLFFIALFGVVAEASQGAPGVAQNSVPRVCTSGCGIAA